MTVFRVFSVVQISILFSTVSLFNVSALHSQETEDIKRAYDVLEIIDDLWRAGSSSAKLEMEVKTEHYTRTMIMDSWTKGKEMSLVRILKPLKEKGTVSLKNGVTMYTYLPKTDRVIRLTSGMMMDIGLPSSAGNAMDMPSWKVPSGPMILR